MKIGCDCGEALEKIAETKIKRGISPYVHHQGFFYKCPECGTRMKGHVTIVGQPSSIHKETYTSLHKYKGRLTNEELAREAPKHEGDLYFGNENEIIARRKR